MSRFLVELSKSRSGKHAIRKALFKVSEDGSINLIEGEGKPVRPTYSKGKAILVDPGQLKKGEYLVYVVLIKNLRGHLKGFFEVYDWNKRMVYRAVYKKLKIRRSMGDQYYSWIVRLIADALKLKVKSFRP